LEVYSKKDLADINFRNKIVIKYIPFVKYIANKIGNKLPSNIDVKDLQSIGIIGLLDAIDRYDPEKGVSFKSYAETRISGTIYDELRKQDTLPRSVRDRIKVINKAKESLERELGRLPTDLEVSSSVGLDINKYHKSLQKGASGKIVYIEDDYNAFVNLVTKDDAYLNIINESLPSEELFDDAFLEIFKDVIKQTMLNLSSDKRLVLSLFYDENLSLKEIAKILYISESRVSQIHAHSIFKIWQNLAKVIESKSKPQEPSK